MPPSAWYAKGARVLGRTAVECTRDRLGDAIGRDVAAIATSGPPAVPASVVDLFAGSGNTLYWVLRHLPGAPGVGFESDAEVFRLTRHSLAALAVPIDIRHTEYVSGLTGLSRAADELLVTFIAPPWGDALDPMSGLDLRRTMPPIAEIVDVLFRRFPHNRLLCAVQVHEIVHPASLAEPYARLDWSSLRAVVPSLCVSPPAFLRLAHVGTRGYSAERRPRVRDPGEERPSQPRPLESRPAF